MQRRLIGTTLGALCGVGLLLWFPYVRSTRVPLLWAADLGFHELGHLLALPLGETAHFLAGSVAQVLVPLGLAGYFWWWRGSATSTGIMLAWAAASAHDVSVYVADAPYQRLQLIGGQHDWTWLLTRWDALDRASGVAGTISALGLIVGLAGVALCLVPLVVSWRATAAGRRHEDRKRSLPVRPARPPSG